MRTLKLALAATAAFAFNANAQVVPTGPHGMGQPPDGIYQKPSWITGGVGGNMDINGIAFHAGGVAACDGCHVMHNAGGGIAKSTNDRAGQPAWSGATNAYLLQGSDQSSTCLICHGASSAKAAGVPGNQFVVADLTGATPSYRSPGGDFGWLGQTWTNSPGAGHGHNVQANDFGWSTDSRFQSNGGVAPGGTFTIQGASPIASFACSSCHDPHGRTRMQTAAGAAATPADISFVGPSTPTALKPIIASGSYGFMPDTNTAVGAYRLLGGKGYEPASKTGFPFPNDPPIAVAPNYYNHDESTSEVRVQYATGMSEWCKNCHSQIHSEGYVSSFGGQKHPAASTAVLKPGQYNVYNQYLSTANYSTGTSFYTSLVPFEQGKTQTFTSMVTAANNNGAVQATATSNVMCLSCHRAHASAFDAMVRWDQNATFLTNGVAGVNGFEAGLTNRVATETAAGYYGRLPGVASAVSPGNGTVMGPYQRSLCNKCHGKD
jgi:predicted CXXCH cytochrome family protein